MGIRFDADCWSEGGWDWFAEGSDPPLSIITLCLFLPHKNLRQLMDTFNRTYFIYDQSTGYVPPSFPSISTFPNIHGSQRLSRITGYGQTAPRSSARVLKASSFLSSYVTQKCQSFLCFFILYASRVPDMAGKRSMGGFAPPCVRQSFEREQEKVRESLLP